MYQKVINFTPLEKLKIFLKKSNFWNSLTGFIKYHNAFAIGAILVLVLTFSAMASENIRDAVIGQEIVTEQGIDNSAILSADLDNFDFQLTIQNVQEDSENYYLNFTYQTIIIQENRWQPVSRENTLKVSKEALAGQDLGLYVAEELGEVIETELAYLKEVQKNEREKGQTKIVQTTTYTGLIGLVLNPETKELPGYEVVVKPTEPESVVSNEPFFKTTCTPNWQCNKWTPAPETVACGESFEQTCLSWADQNNCGTEEGKPTQSQQVTGTHCQAPENGKATCQNNTCQIFCNDGYQLIEDNTCQLSP